MTASLNWHVWRNKICKSTTAQIGTQMTPMVKIKEDFFFFSLINYHFYPEKSVLSAFLFFFFAE